MAEIRYSWRQNAYVVYVQATTSLNFSHAVLFRKNPIKDAHAKLTIKICDKILQNIARRFDVSRTSLSSENKIMKSSIYNEEMNKLKK